MAFRQQKKKKEKLSADMETLGKLHDRTSLGTGGGKE